MCDPNKNKPGGDFAHLIVITNRMLCTDDYMTQLDKVLALHPAAIILREKDLPDAEYELLAKKVMMLAHKHQVPFYLHSHAEMAKQIGCRHIHLSIPALRELQGMPEGTEEQSLRDRFELDSFSVSCHSSEDVREAEAAGAGSIVLGTIFETDCKKGLKGRGVEFVREICAETKLPVYAIGGITPENLGSVMAAGAAGGCMMSGFMKMKL